MFTQCIQSSNMDNNYTAYGGTSLSVSFVSVILLFIGSVPDGVKVVAGIVSIIAGLMATRYYYYATKEKKQNLKK